MQVIDQIFDTVLTADEIHSILNSLLSDDSFHMNSRQYAITNYGFILPTTELIEKIKSYSNNILEVGAGTGYLARILHRAKIDIVATDIAFKLYSFKIGRHFNVKPLRGFQALAAYPDRDVLMSWPCLNKYWSLTVLKKMRPGKFLFYIGEDENGCCATYEFFRELDKHFEFKENFYIPTWSQIHDYLQIWYKK